MTADHATVGVPMLSVRGLSKRFGGVVAAEAIDIDVDTGQTHAVIGPNGSGKTTLLRQIFGEIRPDTGTVHLGSRDLGEDPVPARVQAGLGRSYQITSIFEGFTAVENVSFGLRVTRGRATSLAQPTTKDAEIGRAAGELLARTGLADRQEVRAENLSHGERRQLEIAIALSTTPRLLLLDEPLAGLGTAESQTMIALIRSLKDEHTILMVEHDLDAVFSLADRITILERGRVSASGDPAMVRTNPAMQALYFGAGDAL